MAEYEIVSKTPWKKLEERISELEKKMDVDTKEFYKELINVVRINQEIVDELAKANDALRIELARLVPKIEELIKKLDELITYIKEAATGEIEEKGESKIDKVLEANKKLIETNQVIISLLQSIERNLKRPPLIFRKPPK